LIENLEFIGIYWNLLEFIGIFKIQIQDGGTFSKSAQEEPRKTEPKKTEPRKTEPKNIQLRPVYRRCSEGGQSRRTESGSFINGVLLY
jgi:hypothetical protein